NPDNNVFPETVEQLNEQIQSRDLQSKWVFPLDKQEEFPEAADFLRRNFLVDTIPEFVFNITSFPPPCWDLFNEHQDTDTHMQITIPQSSLDEPETKLTTYHNEQP
ncbi:4800_t:CDS:1, partial [Gigaspora rosea]